MILFGSFQVVPVITVISTFGLVFASVYSLIMMQRAYYGKAKSDQPLPGMTARELFIILLLVVLLVLLGVYPQPILDTSNAAMSNVQHWFGSSVSAISTTRP
jgi:NADH-quinone oxidoreductase subunit M